MASQLAYKVYNGRELVATTVYAEDAAMVAGNTPGSTVKADGRILALKRHIQRQVPARNVVAHRHELRSALVLGVALAGAEE